MLEKSERNGQCDGEKRTYWRSRANQEDSWLGAFRLKMTCVAQRADMYVLQCTNSGCALRSMCC